MRAFGVARRARRCTALALLVGLALPAVVSAAVVARSSTTPQAGAAACAVAQHGQLWTDTPNDVSARALARSSVRASSELRPVFLDRAVSAVVRGAADGIQLIGRSAATSSRLDVGVAMFGTNCAAGPISAVRSADGSIGYQLPDGTSVTVGTPWAYDSAGAKLGTWYSVADGLLTQHIDTRNVTGDVFFDPTYTLMSCSNGYWSALSAAQYLDMYSSSSDYGYCAPRGLFLARNGYLPVWGFETNVANDYGKIPLYQYGGCSFSPDTGWAWDFQVPCKAHDYCYDLRKAGFSGTVSDGACDSAFYWVMEAHCNNRVFSGDCRLVRDSYYAAVRLPNVVTNADPAPVYIQALHSNKCVDVNGAVYYDNAVIDQWTCVPGANNERFRFWPSDVPGYFWIVAAHSGKCADVSAATAQITQWGCGGYPEQRFRVSGSYNQDTYTIRSQLFGGQGCWDVPYSSQSDGVQLIEYGCFETTNQRWRLQ